MKSIEPFVAPESDYFIYSPSRIALETFLYPMQCGIFSYQPGYRLVRDNFDSFLLMYIQQGELDLEFEGRSYHVTSGHFVLLDCYKKHAYSTSSGWECLWCHFDGITARKYCDLIVSRLGIVFSMSDTYPVLAKFTRLLKVFYNGERIREPLLSKYLTDMLTEFLLFTPENIQAHKHAAVSENTIAYINEHFQEDICVEELASKASLSLYHFIRTFKKETGFTPHEYILNTRIATAKYLLKNSNSPVKDVCFSTGFTNESVFCSAFKRRTGLTPSQYRASEK